MNGRRVFKALYNDEGIDRGNVERNGLRIEGVELWSDLRSCQYGSL